MFSVVIPYFNHKKYIKATIASLLPSLSFIDKVVIVDDGSTDGGIDYMLSDCSEIMRSILHIQKQENAGTCGAINKGVSLCSSPYIAILNSDDMFSSNKLQRCNQIFEANSGIEFVWGGIEFIGDDGKILRETERTSWYKEGLSRYENYQSKVAAFLDENVAATSSNMVFKKTLFDEIGGFRDFWYANDLDFALRCISKKKFFFDKNFTHVLYRYHDSNTISENIDATTAEVSEMAREFVQYFSIRSVVEQNEFKRAIHNRGLCFP